MLFRGFSGILAIWLIAIFIYVAFVGWHQVRDISLIHSRVVSIKHANHESHHLHELEMRVREMVACAHDYLITGSPTYIRDFRKMGERIGSVLKTGEFDETDRKEMRFRLQHMLKLGEQIFALPFATGNMEGPILMQEMDRQLGLLSRFMSIRHHQMDAGVNQAMQMVTGLQLDLREDFIVSMAVLFLLLTGLSIYLYRRVVQPLVRLRKGVANIGRGDFTAQYPDFGDNEIGDLARALNTMGQALHKRDLELDQARSFAAHREKMHALGLMTASIAHEVGNPLSAALVSLDVCKRKLARGENDQARTDIDSAVGELRRTENIVRNVLDFGRNADQGQLISNIKSLVENAINLVRLSRRTKSMHFEVDLPDSLPLPDAPEDVIRQVMVNLLLNASDASQPGQTIRIKGSNDARCLYLDVIDQGGGISSDIASEIFSPLFTTKAGGEGTGLGLSISRDLIRRLHGDLELIRNDHHGCCFRVSIPIVREN